MRTKIIFLVLLIAAVQLLSGQTVNAASKVELTVPFTSEIPSGTWTGPWKNACEEASLTMVNQFYLKQKNLTSAQAIGLMSAVFTWENTTFGQNANTDATDTAQMINSYSSFSATIVRSPTLEAIKTQLDNGHPVISFHYGEALHNPLIPFKRGGSYYHVMVIIGYDDASGSFIVNDPGNDASGQAFKYDYQTVMSSLADYIPATGKTTGPPTVIFTAPKVIAHSPASNRLYFIAGGAKQYVSSPVVFKNHNWSWSIVTTMPQAQLDALALGATISK